MKLKGKFGIILTVISIGGVLYTVYLTAKKAPEAKEAKEKALQEKREKLQDENAQLTKMESFEAQAKYYIPIALSTAGTIGTVIGSQFLPQSALNDLQKVHDTYKAVTEKVNGPQAEKKIEEMTQLKLTEGTDGGLKKETFVIQFYGRDILFETTLLDVIEAEYEANRYFRGRGELSFNELLQCYHVSPVEHGHAYGWEENLGGMFYGYCWIDFNHRRGMLGDKPVTFIEFPFYPHPLDEDACRADMEKLSSEIYNHGIEGTA